MPVGIGGFQVQLPVPEPVLGCFQSCPEKEKILQVFDLAGFVVLLPPVGSELGGEDEIRTRGAGCPARRFSKPVVSATHPPLRFCGCVPLTFSKRGAKVSQKCGITK